MVQANKRRDKDLMKLLVSEYEVELSHDNSNAEFFVKFLGPTESPYEGVSYQISWESFSDNILWMSTTKFWLIQCGAKFKGIGNVESESDFARGIPIQITFYWLR